MPDDILEKACIQYIAVQATEPEALLIPAPIGQWLLQENEAAFRAGWAAAQAACNPA